MGKRIASARKALGMTQVKLAEQLGISQQTLAHFSEVGRLRISVNTLDELAKALDVSIESLVHEQPDTAKESEALHRNCNIRLSKSVPCLVLNRNLLWKCWKP